MARGESKTQRISPAGTSFQSKGTDCAHRGHGRLEACGDAAGEAGGNHRLRVVRPQVHRRTWTLAVIPGPEGFLGL